MGSVVQLRQREHASASLTLAAAADAWADAHTASGAWTAGTAKKYRETWRVLARLLHGGPVPGNLAALDTEAGAAALLDAYRAAWAQFGPATRARHLSTMRSAISWWRECGWLHTNPTRGEPIPTIVIDNTRALSRGQLGALLKLDAPLREKTLWRMAYETACRAEELLCLDITDLDLPNKRAAVRQKGNTIKWIHWQSGTAHLLPRLIAGRKVGPLFLADRLPVRAVADADLCPTTGRARLSYRRAAELFTDITLQLANPGVDPAELTELDRLDKLDKKNGVTGARRLKRWTLHQLRHSALTHDAEDGTSDSLLMARSGHRNRRSLGRYTQPGVDAVAAHVASKDPNRRRRT